VRNVDTDHTCALVVKAPETSAAAVSGAARERSFGGDWMRVFREAWNS
jgi:hypothetical protein